MTGDPGSKISQNQHLSVSNKDVTTRQIISTDTTLKQLALKASRVTESADFQQRQGVDMIDEGIDHSNSQLNMNRMPVDSSQDKYLTREITTITDFTGKNYPLRSNTFTSLQETER